MATRTINNRLALDRDGISERAAGAARPTIDRWYANRADNGFPATIPSDLTTDRYDWWWADEIDAFLASLEADRRKALTTVDRSGDPEDMLTKPEAARVLGYRSHRNLPDDFDDCADEVEDLPSGRKRRRWKRKTVWTYADARTGKRGAGPGKGAKNRLAASTRTVDRSGDPNELVRGAEAARILGYRYARNLPDDLKERADKVETTDSDRKWRWWKRQTLWDFADQARR